MNDIFHQEEIEHSRFDNRKEYKRLRRKASATDRSKYKKTDLDKIKKRQKKSDKALTKELEKSMLTGRVLSIISQGITIEHKGKIYTCTLRGTLKQEKKRIKNLITVGDFVFFEKLPDDEGVIHQVKLRRSAFSRADNLRRQKEQLIAANVDQVFITASIFSPRLKPQLIDRYIIAAMRGNTTPIIIVNKIDLLDKDPKEKELYEKFIEEYKRTDIKIISVSALTKEGIPELTSAMKNKTSAFAGQSGVGKTELINITVNLDRPTGETVEKTRKGSHTTTMAELIPLACGGFCVDTPGIQSFGLWEIKPEEIEKYFSEIRELAHLCKYPNCRHMSEPECAVKEAVEKGEISQLRFNSYIALIKSLEKEDKPR